MPTPSRILVPLDLMEGSRNIVDYAIQLARPFNASIEVMHAWEPPQYVAPDLLVAAPGWNPQSLEKTALDAARKELETLIGSFKGPVPITHRLEVGEPAGAILRVAELGGFELIVMGTHGRRGLPRLLLGSVAQKVITRAKCPVLTLHVTEEK
ncbi:universal stress protein [Vitiosangium sp. GDMCC 1.1324]|uniref:universal stress protein n=1 Tax=Vitiosangium sp. (strain GDMCC 1.1324) TaxID=2138576 RepID=UPI000D3DB4F4|nr:universal stress protein [Vitiosangium sp. GDMCC 1.1324]PTL85667.1 universal stress protein [Vitiosangium sp. GDMCC 1.1324]